jgi:predicted nucleotide-binding protein
MAHRKQKAGLKVFIGSAAESLDHAKCVARWLEALEEGHEVVLWNAPGLFVAGRAVLEQLCQRTRQVDGAVIVFGSDDKVWSRGGEFRQPRDNALIEYGLFAGCLGAPRVLICTVGRVKIPSDLGGLVYINISEDRRYIAEQEFRAWLKGLSESDRTRIGASMEMQQSRSNGRNVDRSGIGKASARKTRHRQVTKGIEGDVGPLLDSFLHRDRLDRAGGALKSDPMATALGRVIASDKRFDPALVDRRTELTVHPTGDGQCVVRETVQCRNSTPVIRFLMSGDSPAPDLAALHICARCITPRTALAMRIVKNEPTARSLLLCFDPPIPPNHVVKYEVSWRWPSMWKKLVSGKPDNWRAPILSSLPVKKLVVTFKVDRKIRLLRVENLGDGGGDLKVLPTAKTRISQYRRYIWTMADVEPGGMMDLWLRRASS